MRITSWGGGYNSEAQEYNSPVYGSTDLLGKCSSGKNSTEIAGVFDRHGERFVSTKLCEIQFISFPYPIRCTTTPLQPVPYERVLRTYQTPPHSRGGTGVKPTLIKDSAPRGAWAAHSNRVPGGGAA